MPSSCFEAFPETEDILVFGGVEGYYLFVSMFFLTKVYSQSDRNSLWSLTRSQLYILDYRVWIITTVAKQFPSCVVFWLWWWPGADAQRSCSCTIPASHNQDIPWCPETVPFGPSFVIAVSGHPEIYLTLFSANLCFWHPKFTVKLNRAILSCGKKKPKSVFLFVKLSVW